MDQSLIRESPSLRLWHEYRKQRQYTHRASEALRAARVNLAFQAAEARGLVRLQLEPEDEFYDMSYIDTWEISDKKKERFKKELSDRIDRDGHWILFSQYKDGDAWETADSIGGFVGDDWKNSGYDTDVKLRALEGAGINYDQAELPMDLG